MRASEMWQDPRIVHVRDVCQQCGTAIAGACVGLGAAQRTDCGRLPGLVMKLCGDACIEYHHKMYVATCMLWWYDSIHASPQAPQIGESDVMKSSVLRAVCNSANSCGDTHRFTYLDPGVT